MEPWQRVDLVDVDDARARLSACCGASEWVDRMMQRRPFGSTAALLAAAREVWFALGEDDWREAFRHHPQIGDRMALRARFPLTAHFSTEEQHGVEGASDVIL